MWSKGQTSKKSNIFSKIDNFNIPARGVGVSDGVIILSIFMTLPVGWSLGISLIASFDEWQLLQLSDFMKFTNFIISWVEDAGGGGEGGEWACR